MPVSPRLCLVVALSLAAAPIAAAQETAPTGQDSQDGPVHLSWNQRPRLLDPKPVRIRLSYETTDVSPSERMGVYGIHADLMEVSHAVPNLYLGLGGFGAVSGRRSGFYAAGVSGGWHIPLRDALYLDFGAFGGFSGGAGVPNGDGLTHREHLAFEYELGNLGLRIEAANFFFSGGSMGGQEIVGGLSWYLHPWMTRDVGTARGQRIQPTLAPRIQRVRGGAFFANVSPDSSARLKSGKPAPNSFQMVGLRGDFFLDDTWFLTLSASGAGPRGANGYAKLVGGLGFEMPIAEGFATEVRAQVGSAGGAGMDTGGGFVFEPSVGVRADLGHHTSAAVTYSRQVSVNGNFDANVFAGELAFSTGLADYRPRVPGLAVPNETPLSLWRVEVSGRLYRMASSARLTTGIPVPDFYAMGIGVAYPIAEHVELTAKGYGATSGAPGSYAEGWGGIRMRYPIGHGLGPHWDGLVALAAGYAGGGSMDNGSGGMWDARGGVSLKLNPALDLDVTLGRIESFTQTFAAWVFETGISWRFGLPLAER